MIQSFIYTGQSTNETKFLLHSFLRRRMFFFLIPTMPTSHNRILISLFHLPDLQKTPLNTYKSFLLRAEKYKHTTILTKSSTKYREKTNVLCVLNRICSFKTLCQYSIVTILHYFRYYRIVFSQAIQTNTRNFILSINQRNGL